MEAADERTKSLMLLVGKVSPAHPAVAGTLAQAPFTQGAPHLNDAAEIFLYFLKTMDISGELGDGWDTDRNGLRSWTQESKMNWALAH